MNNKLGQEPAFPVTENIGLNGMSKRFYAACAAMQGLCANPDESGGFGRINRIVKIAYEFADELLKQENE